MTALAQLRQQLFTHYTMQVTRLCESLGWTAQLTGEPVVVPQEQKDGSVKHIRVMKYRVEISNGKQVINFKVGKGRDGYPVFHDSRETKTGAAPLTNRGPLPGEQYTKAGSDRTMTATAWAAQVERLIGAAEIGKIFIGLVKSGFKAG